MKTNTISVLTADYIWSDPLDLGLPCSLIFRLIYRILYRILYRISFCISYIVATEQ